MNLTAVYEPAPEGGYVAWLEEMPGVQTQGETLAETKENLRDAFSVSLDHLMKEVTWRSNLATAAPPSRGPSHLFCQMSERSGI